MIDRKKATVLFRKAIDSKVTLNWSVLSRHTTLGAMSEHSEASYPTSTFIPFMPVRSREAVAAAPSKSPTQPSLKRSAAACAFLLFYVAAYMSVGFAGAAIIERAWLAIVR
jgi:hypothetical protein